MERQTDKTDTTTKGYWWSITAFNEEIDILEDYRTGKRPMPNFWKQLAGGKEACPSNGRPHFQGALHTAETRMSRIKKILPTARIEKCKSTPALLLNYVLKDETAIGAKTTVKNNKFFTMEDVLLKCAEVYVEQLNEETGILCEDDCGYQTISSRVVRQNFFLISLCSQPQMARAWKMYNFTIINVYRERSEEAHAPSVEEQQNTSAEV